MPEDECRQTICKIKDTKVIRSSTIHLYKVLRISKRGQMLKKIGTACREYYVCMYMCVYVCAFTNMHASTRPYTCTSKQIKKPEIRNERQINDLVLNIQQIYCEYTMSMSLLEVLPSPGSLSRRCEVEGGRTCTHP